MPENKIIDDYYSQNDNQQTSSAEVKAKQKHQIKGKLKLKPKSNENETQDKKESGVSFAEKQKSPKKPKITNSFANVESKEAVVGEFTSGGYSTGGFTPKKPFPKKDFKPKSDQENTQPKQSQESSKTQKTETSSSPVKKDFSTPKPFFTSKPVVKSKKTNEGEDFDASKAKKGFKKDKSNKHFKNGLLDTEDDVSFSRSTKIKKLEKKEKKVEDIQQNLTSHAGETITIGDLLSVKELSEKIGVPLMKLITEFMKNGMRVTINSKIDFETASIIAEAFDIKLQKDISSGFDVTEVFEGNIQSLVAETDSSVLSSRAPVISIMGHVDHGKTSLLDHIRHSKVADKEAGGITQSIGAYQVMVGEKKITFLDTPGHEAFTIMRARGAKSTDIAILVVAADEGVKPQTIESINHAREANIPVVVAINKMDKEGANPDFVKGQLAGYGLQPEDWGGDVPMVPVSAKAGTGIDELLDIILIVAEMQELKANPDRLAVGTVIESHLDTKLGPVCTVLINTGTLKKGDSMVCKGAYGKVKVLKDYLGKNANEVGPSTPVLVVGLDSVCEGGDIIQVVSDIEKARVKAIEYKELMQSKKLASASSLDMIMSKIKSGALKQLKIVLKTDSNGSLEALKGALIKLSTPETKVMIIHSGVGNVTEGDVLMCQGSKAILIAFNVDLLGTTRNMIEDNKIELISSKIIYHITEKIEKIITGMLDPKEVEIPLCEAVVGGIFFDDKDFMILGLKIHTEGKIEKNAQVRVIRKDKMVGKGLVENLKSGIIDVDSLEGPIECGIKFKSEFKVEKNDKLEIFKIEIQK